MCNATNKTEKKMTTSNIKKFRLRFRDKPSGGQAAVRDIRDCHEPEGNPVEDGEWEHVATYSGKDHHIEADDEGYHVYRRKFHATTTDDRLSEGVADPRPSQLRERLKKLTTQADINAANAEFWKRK